MTLYRDPDTGLTVDRDEEATYFFDTGHSARLRRLDAATEEEFDSGELPTVAPYVDDCDDSTMARIWRSLTGSPHALPFERW